MPFPHNVYKTQRIVPVRFRRAITGDPDILFPDIDDRGYFRTDAVTGTDHRGHVVGVCEGDSIIVQMRREKVEDAVPLFVTSSNTGTMTVSDFSSGTDALANTHDVDIEITGVSGGAGVNPNVAEVEIRFGSNTGPIIGILTVWVFGILNVNLTPHSVTIADGTGASIGTAVDINAVMDMVKAIWRPCGVDFTVAPIVNDNVVFANAGQAAWQAEINTLLSTNFAPGTINAYFVNQIVLAGSPGVLGLGLSRPNSVAFGTPNPGIILGDTNVSGSARAADTHWLANDLAHEVGHFFTLEHPDRRSPPPNTNFRFDTWAVRMLMHNFNLRPARTDWRNDVGYGVQRRGCLITMKDLVDTGNATHHSTDNECLTSRTTINTAPGPY
jgi:hypothetical protein